MFFHSSYTLYTGYIQLSEVQCTIYPFIKKNIYFLIVGDAVCFTINILQAF